MSALHGVADGIGGGGGDFDVPQTWCVTARGASAVDMSAQL